ncbi:MAG: DUF4364 family protein, partial [Oscillospiraceae bacterium]|nr:DUF4364 family protein [Oscillospiraceae bacterium]
KCDGNLARLNDLLRQRDQVKVQILPLPEGGATLQASLKDTRSELLSLTLYCPAEAAAQDMAAAFRQDPHRVYRAVLRAFSAGEGEGGVP